MEKFVVFPFSLGCVGVAKTSRSQPTKSTKSSILHQAVLTMYKKEIEEVEMEMEIGYPTDVKHVTHVGWDGSTKTLELLSLPSISIKQFELAMAVQAGGSSRF